MCDHHTIMVLISFSWVSPISRKTVAGLLGTLRNYWLDAIIVFVVPSACGVGSNKWAGIAGWRVHSRRRIWNWKGSTHKSSEAVILTAGDRTVEVHFELLPHSWGAFRIAALFFYVGHSARQLWWLKWDQRCRLGRVGDEVLGEFFLFLFASAVEGSPCPSTGLWFSVLPCALSLFCFLRCQP